MTEYAAAIQAVERELGQQEMMLTDPITLRRMMAQRCVRAVLASIRGPSPETILAGRTAYRSSDGDIGIAFTAMVDAVAKET